MSEKQSLESRIRGWLPKETNSIKLHKTKQTNHLESLKNKSTVGMTLLLCTSVMISATQFLEGAAIFVLFIWFSIVVAFSLALDILTLRGKELNMKLLLVSWLSVLSLGGVLANVYVFSVAASFPTRVFSISILAIIHAPLLIAVFAFLHGRRELSRKLMGGFASKS
jgi:hypothetical protein